MARTQVGRLASWLATLFPVGVPCSEGRHGPLEYIENDELFQLPLVQVLSTLPTKNRDA